MTAFLAIVQLITQSLIALPTIEKIVRAAIDVANKAIMEYDLKKFNEELKAAADKAIATKDTSDLEKLAGKQ